MKRRKNTAEHKTGAKTILIGTGAGLGITVVLTMLFAKLILSGTLSEENSQAAAYGIILVSVLCGCFLCAKLCNRQKLPMAMAVMGIYFVLSSLLHALLIQESFCNVAQIAGCCVAGGLIGGLLGTKEKRKYKFR